VHQGLPSTTLGAEVPSAPCQKINPEDKPANGLVRRPKAFAQIFTSINCPCRFQKRCEQQKRLFLQPDSASVPS
jgi:hypothetical protein